VTSRSLAATARAAAAAAAASGALTSAPAPRLATAFRFRTDGTVYPMPLKSVAANLETDIDSVVIFAPGVAQPAGARVRLVVVDPSGGAAAAAAAAVAAAGESLVRGGVAFDFFERPVLTDIAPRAVSFVTGGAAAPIETEAHAGASAAEGAEGAAPPRPRRRAVRLCGSGLFGGALVDGMAREATRAFLEDVRRAVAEREAEEAAEAEAEVARLAAAAANPHAPLPPPAAPHERRLIRIERTIGDAEAPADVLVEFEVFSSRGGSDLRAASGAAAAAEDEAPSGRFLARLPAVRGWFELR
jgi:hypothetical protein